MTRLLGIASGQLGKEFALQAQADADATFLVLRRG